MLAPLPSSREGILLDRALPLDTRHPLALLAWMDASLDARNPSLKKDRNSKYIANMSVRALSQNCYGPRELAVQLCCVFVILASRRRTRMKPPRAPEKPACPRGHKQKPKPLLCFPEVCSYSILKPSCEDKSLGCPRYVILCYVMSSEEIQVS